MQSEIIVVFTDGSCFPNPGFGGWAFVEKKICGSVGVSKSGNAKDTTNNRMEYIACIEAIKHFGIRKTPIQINTDSKLLIDTCTSWMFKWESHGWRKTKNSTSKIKNLDLVKELHWLLRENTITFNWVKGHSGDYFNDLVDDMAAMEVEKLTGGRSFERGSNPFKEENPLAWLR